MINNGQCPCTDLDPFAVEFLENPYPHHEALREAGPVVRIEKYDLVARLIEQDEIDAVHDLAEAFPLSVFPDAMGLTKDGRENLLPYGDMASNAFGPRNQLFEAAFANPGHSRLRGRNEDWQTRVIRSH